MKKNLPLRPALTFEDVVVDNQISSINRRSDIADTQARLAKDLVLNIPIVSANMDTVTDSRMAIAMARLGGLGFIHQFFSLPERMREVEKVKRTENAVIWDPVTVLENATLKKARDLMVKYSISSLLVVNQRGVLVGMLTSRDMRFQKDSNRLVREVMGKRPLVTGSPGFNSEAAKFLMDRTRVEKLPLVDQRGKPVGLITAKDILQREQFPNAARDSQGRLLVGATLRLNNDYLREARELVKAGSDVLLLDTARAGAIRVAEAAEKIKKRHPKIPLVVGNIATSQEVLLLAKAGADCLKVGIGPGAACKTRVESGIGRPQVYAIATCAAIAKKMGVYLIADGGIKNGGCLVKALVAGADAVMVGSLLAGTEEAPGLKIREKHQLWKLYRGSASLEHQLDRIEDGSLDITRNPEGESGKVPYAGSVEEVINGLLGGLRSGMSYVGAHNLQELWARGEFIWVTQAGYEEGKPRI